MKDLEEFQELKLSTILLTPAENQNYFNVSSDYCIIAIVLDPRFKLDFYHDSQLSDRENEDQKNQILATINNAFRKRYYQLTETNPIIEEFDVTQSSRIFKRMKPIIYKDELRNYLNDYARANNDADPLMWWKLHAQDFPNLSKMARDYLSIAGTSAPSERAFSGGIFI